MNPSIERRRFLALTAALAAVPALAACSSGGAARGGTNGTLRAAFAGGGAAETLNYLKGPTSLDYVRALARHGALGVIDPAASDGVRYGVLERIDVSDDLATYTLRVRRGVKFTDGSTLTARDVLYSLNAPVALGSLPFLKPPAQNFDLAKGRVEDDLTLVLPARRPIADGRLILCQSILVFKDGTKEFTPTMPTCGPFKLTEFRPGQGAAFVRHDEYYGLALGGGPHVAGLELRSMGDATARVNALRAGQVDFAADLGPVASRTLASDSRFGLEISKLPHATALSFSMNLAHAPFRDARVRQAFKLAIDRKSIVDKVLFGHGFVGNDLPSLGFPDYATGIGQRPYDPDRARELLREAGADGMRIALTSGPETSGMIESATLYVENLKAVGVDATLDQRPAGQLYADMAGYFKRPFVGAYSPPGPLLSQYESTHTAGAPSAFGFDRSDIDDLVKKARGARLAADRAAAALRAQQLIWDEGNSVVPVFVPSIDGRAAGLSGVRSEPFATFTEARLA